MIDSLEVGGAERMAVAMANHLRETSYRPFLCATRKPGPLLARLAPEVGFLALRRRATVDPAPIAAFRRFIRANDIAVLHAHSTSLFLALAAAGLRRRPAVVWHMHYGGFVLRPLHQALFRWAARRADAVVAVSDDLRQWAETRLNVPRERVFKVPNFVTPQDVRPAQGLPGVEGSRIVCVANLRPPKDQITLIRAMRIVAAARPEAHLLLAGAAREPDYLRAVADEIARSGLGDRVTLLGQRLDIPAVLAACDIGVLSSTVEGLPLSLLEYGAAGLCAVATDVGECAEVLDHGRAGALIPPRDPGRMAGTLLDLLASADRRKRLGAAFLKRIEERYSARAATAQVSRVYQEALRNA